MTISGFTIVRNANLYDFPIKESILSALPIVDEFIVVVGDSEDNTLEIVSSINSPKIKIIQTNWDTKKFNKDGNIYAQQTELALRACKGDWCLYLQADEVLHENGYEKIKNACNHYLNNQNVEGFVLKYIHFYGNYEHYIDALHFAYPKEIRIVRNTPQIHSWKDAQSFRYLTKFDGFNFGQIENSRKLNCIIIDAFIYHYGWCRNPRKIGKKIVEQKSLHDGEVDSKFKKEIYDYGNLSYFPKFNGKNPSVMEERINNMDWEPLLRYNGLPSNNMKKKFGLKYRILTFIENKILNGNRIGGFKNYKVLKSKH